MKRAWTLKVSIDDILKKDEELDQKQKGNETIKVAALQDELFKLRSDIKYSGSKLCHELLNYLSAWAENEVRKED